MEKKFNLSDEIGNPTSNDYVDGCLKQEDVKEFIKRENTEIFTEGFWNYVWINYFNEEDEEIFQKMIKHIEKRVKEKRDELAGDKLI